MRLHSLELAAFGPFPDRVAVDLDLLGSDGLFLLHGDTGAGKTTLLDAIAFALFGRVPGARNEAKRLRCDRAQPTTRTFVRLEATLGGHRVEIVRSPAYLRPKARGAGSTEEKHKVVLRWLDSPPDGFRSGGLTRAEEVGNAVRDLLGMSADQFFQVVLLPQGEFARFLRSDTADREVLLERLFDTGRFGTVEEWFSAARRDSGVRVRESRQRIDQLVARVAEAAGAPMCTDVTTAQWLADIRDRLADQAAAAVDAAEQAAGCAETADEVLTGIRSVASRLHRLRALRLRQDELVRSATKHAGWRRAVAACAEAAPVVAAARTAGRLAGRAAEVQREVDGLRLVAEQWVAPRDDVPKTAVDLRAGSATARLEAGALAGLQLLARDQEADRLALRAAERSLKVLRRGITDVEAELIDLPVLGEALARRVDVAREAAGELPMLARRATDAEAVLDAARSVTLRQTARTAAAGRLAAAVDEHQRCVDVRQRLVEHRIAGMAAELAGSLLAGHACAVCGAVEHPQPAPPNGESVTRRQLADAERREHAAAVERQQATAREHEAAVALVQAEHAAMGRTVTEAADAYRLAADQQDARSRTAADLAPAQEEWLRSSSRLTTLSAQRQLLHLRIESVVADCSRLTAAVSERAGRLEGACCGFPDIAGRREHLLLLADALDRLAAATERLDAAELSCSEARTALVRALDSSPFLDLGQAEAAAAIDQADLLARLRAAEDELTGLTAQLSDPELSGLDDVAVPDVHAAESIAGAARQAARTTALEAAAAVARRDQVAAAAARLAAAARELEPVLAADAELAALTDVIHGRGQNARAMSLRTYVLAAKLAEVAQSAGHRLAAMSGGRYTFVPSQDRETKSKTGGLGLDILDSFSGLVRPAKTLSGGESFLASLALALGLADAVAAEAGGRQLDTMFIDEGFGSLDAETLDMVMGTLDELRAGGRIVGLVSHVDELRQRIPSRLRIRRTAGGSELELSTC